MARRKPFLEKFPRNNKYVLEGKSNLVTYIYDLEPKPDI